LRFCSRLRVGWDWTRIPVGMWMRETEEEVLLIAWPPGPEPVRGRVSRVCAGGERRGEA
jgi:hypothetical protein